MRRSIANWAGRAMIATGMTDAGSLLSVMQKGKDKKVIRYIELGLNLNNRGVYRTSPMLLLLSGGYKVPVKYLPVLRLAGSDLYAKGGELGAYVELSQGHIPGLKLQLIAAVVLLFSTDITELDRRRPSKYGFSDRINRTTLSCMFTTTDAYKPMGKVLKHYDTRCKTLDQALHCYRARKYEKAAFGFLQAANEVTAALKYLDSKVMDKECKAYFAHLQLETLYQAAACVEKLAKVPSSLEGLGSKIAVQEKLLTGTMVAEIRAKNLIKITESKAVGAKARGAVNKTKATALKPKAPAVRTIMEEGDSLDELMRLLPDAGPKTR